MPPTAYKPAVHHRPHPDSKLCQDFHWVPYPLGLMPYDSWYNLHHREDVQPSLPFRCPVCRKERQATAHARKVFLVAERLTWEEGYVSIHDRDLNEELNWGFNFELGIPDPAIEDPEYVVGGKKSRSNKFHPYQNEYEMKLALKLIFMAEKITATSWAVWIGTQLDLEGMVREKDHGSVVATSSGSASGKKPFSLSERRDSTRFKTPEVELIDLTGSPDRVYEEVKKPLGLPTPSSSSGDQRGIKSEKGLHQSRTEEASENAPSLNVSASPDNCSRIVSYKSLQDFYSLLDRIERTSYVGALYLEAYAEKLRDDMCQACWFDHNVRLDMF